MKNKSISRRDALKMMGAFCASPLTACTGATDSKKKEPAKKYKRLIFFFSATGNSLYIAKEIAGTEGTLMSIPQEIHNENPTYEAEEIGFVFPLYCFIAPAIVQDFITQSTFKADYIFAVGTFGANSTIFPEYFDQFAREHGFVVNYINAIKMVDTYLPFYDMAEQKAQNKHIPEQLATVLSAINNRENFHLPVTEREKQFCEGYYHFSGRDRVKPTLTRSEKIVFSTDDCVGCGVCVSICPHGSWKLENGRSVPQGVCENCLACVQNCPKKAISIIPTPPEPEEPNRNVRYRNPNIKLGEIIKANCQNT